MALKDGHPDAHLWMQAAVPKSRRGIFTAKAKKAFQNLFALWKDADKDIPVLMEARKEYEKL